MGIRKPGRKECDFKWTSKLDRWYSAEIRFDRADGEFFAEFGGISFKDPSIRELEGKLRARADELESVTWNYWIEVVCITPDHWTFGPSSRQEMDLPFVGLEFDIKCLTDPQEGVERRDKIVTLNKETLEPEHSWLQDDDTVGQRYGEVDEDSTILIPFTKERWQTLVKIQEAIKGARRKLHTLLGADGESLILALDNLKVPQLMGALDDDAD